MTWYYTTDTDKLLQFSWKGKGNEPVLQTTLCTNNLNEPISSTYNKIISFPYFQILKTVMLFIT